MKLLYGVMIIYSIKKKLFFLISLMNKDSDFFLLSLFQTLSNFVSVDLPSSSLMSTVSGIRRDKITFKYHVVSQSSNITF